MRSIAVLNLKGGSGKTTTALNLAVGLARLQTKKKRVLLIDADAQANASFTILDGHAAAAPTLGHVLLGQAELSEAIRPTRIPLLDILPAAGSLANAALQLAEEWGREQRLRTALRTIEDDYELCVIDSPPSLSLVTVNVLRAVDEVLVPVDSGIYSVAGLGRLKDTISEVRKHLDHAALHIIGLVLTKAMPRSASTRGLEDQLREMFPDLVYKTVIPYDPKVEHSLLHHRSVVEHSPTSKAALAYGELTKEVLKHGQKPVSRTPAKADPGPGSRGKKRRAS